MHVADVCYFVTQGSALDKEAAQRSTTFYLVDRRFDMLPALLSGGEYDMRLTVTSAFCNPLNNSFTTESDLFITLSRFVLTSRKG